MEKPPYQETRNPVTGKVTTTGTNPYRQNIKRYGNRPAGVGQAARARKKLMELRKGSQAPAAGPPAPSGNPITDALAETAWYAQQQKQKAEDQATVKSQAEAMKKRAETKNPKTGRNYTPGFNLGLSENEIAFNEAVRSSSRGLKNRMDRIRNRLDGGAQGKRAEILRNRLGTFRTRRNNFRRQLFAPTGENAPKMPKAPKRPRKRGGSGGGGYGDGSVAP